MCRWGPIKPLVEFLKDHLFLGALFCSGTQDANMCLWNLLPIQIRLVPFLLTFWRDIRTVLFCFVFETALFHSDLIDNLVLILWLVPWRSCLFMVGVFCYCWHALLCWIKFVVVVLLCSIVFLYWWFFNWWWCFTGLESPSASICQKSGIKTFFIK